MPKILFTFAPILYVMYATSIMQVTLSFYMSQTAFTGFGKEDLQHCIQAALEQNPKRIEAAPKTWKVAHTMRPPPPFNKECRQCSDSISL